MSARHLVAEGEGKIRKGNKKPKKTALQNPNTQPSKAQTQLSKLIGVDGKVLKEKAPAMAKRCLTAATARRRMFERSILTSEGSAAGWRSKGGDLLAQSGPAFCELRQRRKENRRNSPQ